MYVSKHKCKGYAAAYNMRNLMLLSLSDATKRAAVWGVEFFGTCGIFSIHMHLNRDFDLVWVEPCMG